MIHVKNLVVGAGPAGLQVAYYLQKMGIEYLVLEKAEKAASFFTNYPLSGSLISINKPNTGRNDPEFNLRHDWNSLIQDEENPLLFPTTYSTEYYPKSDDLVKYLNDFAVRYSLKIQYSVTVQKIYRSEGDRFRVECLINGEATVYTCEKLIVATGLSKMVLPNYPVDVKTPIKHYGQYEKGFFKDQKNLDTFKNKSLLLIGGGNASYELATLLTPYCSNILILTRSDKSWAQASHYTGDLRSTYLSYMDTFLLKSQNAVDVTRNTTYSIYQETDSSQYIVKTNNRIIHESSLPGIDTIIYCTGWKFDDSIFDFPLTLDGKYPKVLYNYESFNSKNLFFIGSLMHSLDFKRSSGGFIHGFRYLIKYFMQMNFSMPTDTSILKKDGVADYIINKLNSSSALYQMYGQMCDLFYLDGDDIHYINNVTVFYHMSESYVPKGEYNFALTLEYGHRQVTEIIQLGKKLSGLGSEVNSSLLHPVLCVYKDKTIVDVIHFDEDLFANFIDKKLYLDKLRRALKMFI